MKMTTKTLVCKVPHKVRTFAEAIKVIREMLGITQGELAVPLGLSLHSIMCYETNRRTPKANVLPKIWRLLNEKIQAITKSSGMDRIPTDIFSPEAMEQYESCQEIAEELDAKLRTLDILPASNNAAKRRAVILKKMIENQMVFFGLLQRIKAQITKGS